jgi:hypothetical protein
MLSSNKNLKVIKELLKGKARTQKGLAESANVSVGLVNKVIKRLRDSFLISVDNRGILLRDHSRLFVFLSVETPMTRRFFKRYVSPLSSNETILLISEKLENVNYAYTLLSAIPKYSYIAGGENISLYVDELQKDKLDSIFNSISFSEKGIGTLVEVYLGSEGILYDKSTENRAKYVSNEQLLIDIYSSPYSYLAPQLIREYLDKLVK